jgi:hypothetical protein
MNRISKVFYERADGLGVAAGSVVLVLVIGACFYGWAMNIVKMVDIADQLITGMFILRGIGILLAPIGVILGYL